MNIESTAEGRCFEEAAERHRTELLVHCYRMTGSVVDAEELVQETYLRAWRHRDRFEGRASMRTWLYRIATNACLDWLEQSARRVLPVGLTGSPVERVPWLQPIADDVLDRAAAVEDGPEASAIARETVELAFLAALQLLPPRQRAVFVARDVVGLPASEVAALLDTTVEAVNSLVQRARASLREAGAEPSGITRSPTDAAERDLLAKYVDAHERSDLAALEALVRADVVLTMPPDPTVVGVDALRPAFAEMLDAETTGTWKLVPVRANRRPATACYLRRPGEQEFRALSVDVLHIEGDAISVINCFFGETPFAQFGLPVTYDRSTEA